MFYRVIRKKQNIREIKKNIKLRKRKKKKDDDEEVSSCFYLMHCIYQLEIKKHENKNDCQVSIYHLKCIITTFLQNQKSTRLIFYVSKQKKRTKHRRNRIT